MDAQIAKQKLELEKSRQEIEQQNSALTDPNAPDMPLEVKQQIPTVTFSIQADQPGFAALRQGVLSADSK